MQKAKQKDEGGKAELSFLCVLGLGWSPKDAMQNPKILIFFFSHYNDSFNLN